MELWLANHGGSRRKALALTSLAAHRQWCCFGSFTANLAAVSKSVEAAFEASIRDGCRAQQPTAIAAAVAKKLPPLLDLIEMLSEHVKLIAVPLSHRVVELELDPETELQDVQQLIKAALAQCDQDSSKSNFIFKSVQQGDRFKAMKQGKSPDVAVMSPMRHPPAPTQPSGEDSTPTLIIARHLEFEPESASNAGSAPMQPDASDETTEAAQPGAGSGSAANSKRQRTPPAIYEPDQRQKKRPKNFENLGTNVEGPRHYTKSGLYSKDPVKAAIAREKLGVSLTPKAPAEKKKKPAASTPVHSSECFARIRIF